MKVAVLFPGQGAQYTGMGRSLYEKSAAARKMIDMAGEEIKELCFNGEASLLQRTDITQKCMFAIDMAAAAALSESLPKKVKISAAAGFSLGEYAAICFARGMTYEDTLAIVKERGELMNSTADGVGTMAAAIGDIQKVKELIEEIKGTGLIMPVNYNCPGQTVVAGENLAVSEFVKRAKEFSLRAIPLKVSGPFHSPLMQKASDGLLARLEKTEFLKPVMPVYANLTAEPYEKNKLKDTLIAQMTNPVLFEQTIRNMSDDGINCFIECGPGKTLSGFVKRILPDAKILNIEDEESLKAALSALEEEAKNAKEQSSGRNRRVAGYRPSYSAQFN